MLLDVAITDLFRYDGNVAYELWLNYLRGIASIDLLITYLRRLVIVRVNSKYAHLSLDIREDLVQTAITEIWRQAVRRKFPAALDRPFKGQVSRWHQYLHTIIDRRLARAFFEEIYDDAPKMMTVQEYDRPYLYRFPTRQQVEDRIFLDDELPVVIRTEVLGHLRFDDEGFREASGYVVDQILSGKRIVRSLIRRSFGVSNYKFLIEHVLVLIRSYLYRVRETLKARRSNEDSPLEEFYDMHYADG